MVLGDGKQGGRQLFIVISEGDNESLVLIKDNGGGGTEDGSSWQDNGSCAQRQASLAQGYHVRTFELGGGD